ncbi:MAG: 4'-phosphopantetheinyl transferase family protein [Bacteroidia bacterium]
MKIFCNKISPIKFEDAFYELDKNSIHVWLVEVTNENNILSTLREIFNADENKRTDRFAFEKDRNQFITAHGSLRKILSKYLSVETGQIQFRKTGNKKPYILFPPASLKFNISHSENKILIAVSDNEIGVDIEKIKPGLEYNGLVKNYFSIKEQQIILNSKMPGEAFYKLWTRKEAVLKANGMGISDDLKNIEVCSDENHSPFNQDYYISSFLIENFYGSVASPVNNNSIYFFKYNF